MGAAFLLVAICLGIWAHSASKNQALLEWQHTQGPSPLLWKGIFQAKGYSVLENPLEQQRLIRTLPLSLDSQNSVLLSQDRKWIAVFGAPENEQNPWIFTAGAPILIKKELPKTWEPLGSGWIGLEATLQKIEAKTTLHSASSVHSKINPFTDPRALQY